MGVDIFFVISGFVISLAAFGQVDRDDGKNFISSFMQRRIRRIVPLHYLTMLIFVLFISPEIIFNNFTKNLFFHLVFIHNTSPNFHGAINGSNWSLGTEMQFYVLIALVGPWLRGASIYKFSIPALVIVYTWRYLVFNHSDLTQSNGVFHLFVYATQLPGMLDEFLVGVLLARFVRTNIGTILLSRKYISTISFMVLSIIMICITFHLYLQYGEFWNYLYMVVFFRTLIALTTGCIILFLCSLKLSREARVILYPFYYGGAISYGIYLWHLPIIFSVKKIAWLNNQQSLVLIIVLTFVISILSWNFFEKSFIKK